MNMHQIEGTIPALSVVEYDEKYGKLVKYLLGNVFIAENEDALAKQQRHCGDRKNMVNM